jgi:integrase
VVAGFREGRYGLADVDRFLDYLVGEGRAPQTVLLYLSAVKRWLKANGVHLDYEELEAPRMVTLNRGQPFTKQELRVLLKYAGPRERALTLFLASSGVREGAIPHLKLGDLEPQQGCVKVLVYRGDPEEYVTFITPEAWEALQDYLEWRRRRGEKITVNSPVFRTHHFHARKVKPLSGRATYITLSRLLEEADLQGERQGHMHQKRVHCFRKFFRTMLSAAGVDPLIAELLMGHQIGVSKHYFFPTEDQLRQAYLKAIPHLTVNETFEVQQHYERALKERDRELLELHRLVQGLKAKVDRLLGED